MITRIEPCESRGNYVLDIKAGEKWETLGVGYLSVLQAMQLKIENAFAKLQTEIDQLTKLIDTPETEDFDKAVHLEAAHQVKRWSAEHDAGKTAADWFWLIGYLAGKALHADAAGNTDKAKHHTISTAAALRNWHAHLRSGESAMRPGIKPPEDLS